jgi:uncharacterized protein (TIGR02147 family)
MSIFDFNDYKEFVIHRIRNMPQQGRGQFRQIALHLRIHTTMVSQVFRGSRDLSPEQGCELAEYLGLSELEADYFLRLIEKNRAGTEKLRARLSKELAAIREKALQLQHRLPAGKKLDERDRAVFYSQWYYQAIRLLTSIPGAQKPEVIARSLNLPLGRVREVLAFLVAVGLCTETNDVYQMGAARTHIEKASPLASRHHTNWRLKAIEHFEHVGANELAFTAPMTLSESDASQVHKRLIEFIEWATALATQSSSESLYCFNVDWFGLVRV